MKRKKHNPHGYGQRDISTFYSPESHWRQALKIGAYILKRFLSKSAPKTPLSYGLIET